MIFENDLLIEEKGYNDIIKPFLKRLGLDSVFIRYSSKEQNVLFNYLNKTKDIDFITDNGKKNQTISLKVVQLTDFNHKTIESYVNNDIILCRR